MISKFFLKFTFYKTSVVIFKSFYTKVFRIISDSLWIKLCC